MNDFFFKLKWSPFFREVKNFGVSLVGTHDISSIEYRNAISPYRADENDAGIKYPEWIKSGFPVNVDVILLFGSSKNSIGLMHKDGPSIRHRYAALNIPILGCSRGLTEWFTDNIEETPIREVRDNQNSRYSLYEKISEKRLELLPAASTYLDSPMLLNTNVWHRVNNTDNNNNRWVLSFRFKNNPTYQELVTIFKNEL